MRKPTRDVTGFVPGGTPCPTCGKKQWYTRADAKAVAKKGHQGDSVNVYRCGEFFHIGHLPAAVRRGLSTRSDIVNRTSRGSA